MTAITHATAFVDWNSQIHLSALPTERSELQIANRVLNYVCRVVSRALAFFGADRRFDVTLRVYHGWHHGFEVTPRRRALIQTIAGADFSSLSTRANVVIRRDVQFGDRLVSAPATRLYQRLGCHLPNTVRKSLTDPARLEEKMVDTAIASEVVDLAHREPQMWLVIVGDDDDLIPPLYVAEGARQAGGRRVLVIRTRPPTPFLNLTELSYKP